MQIGRNGGPLQKAIPRDDAEPALQRTPLIPFASISFVFSACDRDTDNLVRLEVPFVRGEREKRKLPPATAIYDINERI